MTQTNSAVEPALLGTATATAGASKILSQEDAEFLILSLSAYEVWMRDYKASFEQENGKVEANWASTIADPIEWDGSNGCTLVIYDRTDEDIDTDSPRTYDVFFDQRGYRIEHVPLAKQMAVFADYEPEQGSLWQYSITPAGRAALLEDVSATPTPIKPATLTDAILTDANEQSMELTFQHVPVSTLDHFLPGAINDFLPAFRATFDDDWPQDVAITVKLTARPSSFDGLVDAEELQQLEPEPESTPLTAIELAEDWRGQVVERFVTDLLPLQRTIEVGDEQELSDDELDTRYLAWLANQSEIRVKIRRRPGLPASAFTTLDRSRSPLEPYELSLEVLSHEKAA